MAEPAEKQEDVPDPNALILKMTLIATCLTEYGTPAYFSWKTFFVNIRISMRIVVKWQAAIGQVSYDGTKRPALEEEIII